MSSCDTLLFHIPNTLSILHPHHACIMPTRISTHVSNPRLLLLRHKSNRDGSPHFQPVCVL